ncbi:MAG: hypothetical protein V3S81_05590 [Anaerolineales bacterium]
MKLDILTDNVGTEDPAIAARKAKLKISNEKNFQEIESLMKYVQQTLNYHRSYGNGPAMIGGYDELETALINFANSNW